MVDFPPGWQRTPPGQRVSGQFGRVRDIEGFGGHTYRTKARLTTSNAIQDLVAEVKRLAATDLRIDTDVPTRLDGMPKSGSREPDDPGAVVYFRLHGQPVVFACDRYTRVADNLRAIAKTLEAKRGIERWGCATGQREFEGYRALPPPGGGSVIIPEPPAHLVLGVAEDAPAEVVRAAGRALMMKTHPDRGGSAEEFQRVKRAMDRMLGGA